MLSVSGKCLSCHPQKVEGTKNGKSYSFTKHRCCIHHPQSGMNPIYINTGETPMIPDRFYKVMVRVRPYLVGEGENVQARVELLTYKDHPPKEVTPPSSKESANA